MALSLLLPFIGFLCCVAPLTSQNDYELSFYEDVDLHQDARAVEYHFPWSEKTLGIGGYNLRLNSKITRIRVPDSQKKGYWLTININNRSDSEIIAIINKGIRPTKLEILKKTMKFKAESADMEGFYNEESVMKVQKEFDGEGWLTIVCNEQFHEFSSENKFFFLKTIRDTRLQVSIRAILPDENSPCIETCRNNSLCNKVSKKCDCFQKKYTLTNKIHSFGRDCNKTVIVDNGQTSFKQDFKIDIQQSVTIAIYNPILKYKSNIFLQSIRVFQSFRDFQYMAIGFEISEDDSYDPNANQRKRLSIANRGNFRQMSHNSAFNSCYYEATNIQNTKKWTYINIYNLNPNYTLKFSLNYEIMDYYYNHPEEKLYNMLQIIFGVLFIIICSILLCTYCQKKFIAKEAARKDVENRISDIIRDYEHQFVDSNCERISKKEINKYFEKFYWNSDQSDSDIKDICTICLDAFENDTKMICRRIPFCRHVLHDKCFLEQTKSQNSCPNCKIQFTSEILRKYK